MFRNYRSTHSLRNRSRSGFSMVEVMVSTGLVVILAGMSIMIASKTRPALKENKLRADVQRLNQIVSLFLSEGGSLSGLTSAQAVIDKLKTVRSQPDAMRQVGVLTGRGVDLRLQVRNQTAEEAASGDLRAVWNPTTNKFDLATSGASAGVAEFYLADTASTSSASIDAGRAPSSSKAYNGQNGWVWDTNLSSSTSSPTSVALAPTPVSLYIAPSSSQTTQNQTLTTLPKPSIAPTGGNFVSAQFPSSVAIYPNGAPGGGLSVLRYRLNEGEWTDYVGPLTIAPQTRVDAKNFSLNETSYLSSDEDSQAFYQLVDAFAGSVVPTWSQVTGGNNLAKTVNNTNQNSVVATHGTAVSGSTSNSLTFNRSAFNIAPDTDFKIGQVVYRNGTVQAGTEASGIHLHLDFNVTLPQANTSSIDVHLSLWSSLNTSNAAQSADYTILENPITDFHMTVGGVTYTLQLKFANIAVSEGWTNGTTLWVYEDENGHADLIGRFVSVSTTLPTPIISPRGGTFADSAFPDTVTISRNGAPTDKSQLQYRINNGPWQNYTSAVPIKSGDTVDAKNIALDTTLYQNSATNSESYFKLVDSFTAQITPTWSNVSGGPNLVHTIDNSNLNLISVSHGGTSYTNPDTGEVVTSGAPNLMNFARAGFAGLPANTDFVIGNLVFVNGTTFNDSEGTSATLNLNFQVSQPIVTINDAPLYFTMVSTPNDTDRVASADTVTLENSNTSFTIVSDGITYTLYVWMECIDPDAGFANGNTFYIYEGASATGLLKGRFVSSR